MNRLSFHRRRSTDSVEEDDDDDKFPSALGTRHRQHGQVRFDHHGSSTTARLVCSRLALDHQQVLRMGCCESFFTHEDYNHLAASIRKNASLREVTIGWRLPRRVIIKLLKAIVTLPNIQSLTLISICNVALPPELMRQVIAIPTLRHLDIGDVCIQRKRWVGFVRRPGTRHIVQLLPYGSPNLKRLRLSN